MGISTGGFSSIEQITGQYLNGIGQSKRENETDSFKQVLQEVEKKNENGLVFSKHATQRLSDRNITLSDEQIKRLNAGSDKAQEKGIAESLVLLDNLAFIVNTKNRTVITAMNSDNQDENVYTNIDGAVVI